SVERLTMNRSGSSLRANESSGVMRGGDRTAPPPIRSVPPGSVLRQAQDERKERRRHLKSARGEPVEPRTARTKPSVRGEPVEPRTERNARPSTSSGRRKERRRHLRSV